MRAGRHHEHFIVDMIQGGAGTSTNMNANEVIANRALEILGRARGTYDVVHPNEHVNRSQSTNDVYPTSIRIALHTALDELRDALKRTLRRNGCQVGRVQRHDQDGPHAVAGRRADDTRPRVQGMGAHADGRCRSAGRSAGADARDEHGRHRHRHRHHRVARSSRSRCASIFPR